MKTILHFIVILSLSINVCYASDYDVDVVINPESMEEEDIDYDEIIQNSSSHPSIETEEKSEYDVQMKDYVSVKYTSTRKIIERK
jgi:hypothetical protein